MAEEGYRRFQNTVGSRQRQTGSDRWELRREGYPSFETRRSRGITAAHVAAKNGAHQLLEMILSHGGDPNAQLDADGTIHEAIKPTS